MQIIESFKEYFFSLILVYKEKEVPELGKIFHCKITILLIAKTKASLNNYLTIYVKNNYLIRVIFFSLFNRATEPINFVTGIFSNLATNTIFFSQNGSKECMLQAVKHFMLGKPFCVL